MKLSKRGEYALRALIDLGIASELGLPMLQASELAAKEKLPLKFWEQIFYAVKGGRLCQSARSQRRVPSQRVTRAGNYFLISTCAVDFNSNIISNK